MHKLGRGNRGGVANSVGAVAISPKYLGTNHDIAVGMRTGVPGAFRIWVLQVPSGAGWILQLNAPVANADIVALRFSPLYSMDAALAVAFSTSDATYYNIALRNILANTIVVWVFLVPGIEVKSPVSPLNASPGAAQIVTVDLEPPSNFSGQTATLRRVYISTDDAGAGSDVGLFRVDDNVVLKLNCPLPVSRVLEIVYFGTCDSGTLLISDIAGPACAPKVMTWYTPTPTDCPIEIWCQTPRPADGSTNMPVDALVTATFSEHMNESTINDTSFTLAGSTSTVEGMVTYDRDTYTATFTPEFCLDYNHQYTATLNTAITDIIGNPLLQPYVWTFTTQQSEASELPDDPCGPERTTCTPRPTPPPSPQPAPPTPERPRPSPPMPKPPQLSPAILCVKYLKCSPDTVTVGQPVTISANIANDGDLPSGYTATLKINGKVEGIKMGTVDGHSAVPVSFVVSKSEPGTYTVNIDGQQAKFTVIGTGSDTDLPHTNGGLVAILLVSLLIIATVGALILTGRRPT